jgi:flagellar biosynthesis GTPase FlhF
MRMTDHPAITNLLNEIRQRHEQLSVPRRPVEPPDAIPFFEAAGLDTEHLNDFKSLLASQTLGSLSDELAFLERHIGWNPPEDMWSGTHVFIGGSGCGKTTVLSKWLAQAVLVQECDCAVWRMDGRTPNTAEHLNLHCDALQVPVLRGNTDEPSVVAGLRFIDLPGTDWRDQAAVRDLTRFQDANLHLVLNGAYHQDVLLKQIEAFEGLGLKSLIFSHLDEDPRWGRLLSVALRSGHQASYLSAGQNVPGNFNLARFRQFLQPKLPKAARNSPVANLLLNNNPVSSL